MDPYDITKSIEKTLRHSHQSLTENENYFYYRGDTSLMKTKIINLRRTRSLSEVRKRASSSCSELKDYLSQVQPLELDEKNADDEMVDALMQVEEDFDEKWKKKDKRYIWIRGFLSTTTITLYVFYGLKWIYDIGFLFIWGPVIPILVMLGMGLVDILIMTAGVLVKKAWRNYGLNVVIFLVIWSLLVHLILAALSNELDQMESQLKVLPIYFILHGFYILFSLAFKWIHKKHEKNSWEQNDS